MEQPLRWKSGMLNPPAGSVVELPLPDIEMQELELLMTYYGCIRQAQEDRRNGIDDGIAVDVPEWASNLLLSSGFGWTVPRIQALVTSVCGELDPEPDTEELPDDSPDDSPDNPNFQEDLPPSHGEIAVEADSMELQMSQDEPRPSLEQRPPDLQGLRKTRWGRCMAPWCRNLALQPVLGSRGPFLSCSAKSGCRFKKELTVAQWRTLPKKWLNFWPVSWAGVKPWLRPKRPVSSLGPPKPRRISRAAQAWEAASVLR
ncbi:unnamed protein product [Cladocopium goreaui]|uniref:CDP-diacylglycerol--glycerol-3-phosphate 3-phosphatidyltransferase n=1 Tax=Cladocopium goreaui TaxID=2562237 RepID=A0A9P1G024_9DINO|nr:unnamed protein product [Cladocopium goreaui]